MEQASELLKGHVFTAERFAEYQRKLREADEEAEVPELMLQLIELETLGGNCPRCKKPWKKIEVKNECADFTYYSPDCKCYPCCPKCGTSFHREWAMGERDFSKCTSCYWTSHPIFQRKCGKCGHWFMTPIDDYGPHMRCEACGRPRARKENSQKIDLAELAQAIRDVKEPA